MARAVKKVVIAILLLLMVLVVWGCAKNIQDSTEEGAGSTDDVVAEALARIEAQEQDGQPAEGTNLSKLSVSEVMANAKDSVYLDGVHFSQGVTCENCHGEIAENQPVVLPKDDVCLKCHEGSYEKLAAILQSEEQWQTYNPHNPHDREACITCHHSHEAFELTCKACHNTGNSKRFR